MFELHYSVDLNELNDDDDDDNQKQNMNNMECDIIRPPNNSQRLSILLQCYLFTS